MIKFHLFLICEKKNFDISDIQCKCRFILFPSTMSIIKYIDHLVHINIRYVSKDIKKKRPSKSEKRLHICELAKNTKIVTANKIKITIYSRWLDSYIGFT